MASWAVDTAVFNARNTISPLQYGEGACAAHVRASLEAAGIYISRPASNSAKDYGPSLLGAGFRDIGQAITWIRGDVVVFPAVPRHPDGHIAIYDGVHWVSDFVQPSILANRQDYKGASYKVYRKD
ncbi:NlpC/P60 family protein [Spirosoma flavus]